MTPMITRGELAGFAIRRQLESDAFLLGGKSYSALVQKVGAIQEEM